MEVRPPEVQRDDTEQPSAAGVEAEAEAPVSDPLEQVPGLSLDGLVQLWASHGDGVRGEELMLRLVRELPEAAADALAQGAGATAAAAGEALGGGEATADALRRIMEDMAPDAGEAQP